MATFCMEKRTDTTHEGLCKTKVCEQGDPRPKFVGSDTEESTGFFVCSKFMNILSVNYCEMSGVNAAQSPKKNSMIANNVNCA